MLFGSDNWAGAADEVMAALQRANAGLAPAYGGDALTRAVEQRFAEVFDHEVAVFFVATGGAANGLALSALTPPWGMVLCHEESHIQMDECAGPEFFTGGAKLLPMPGHAAKLDADTVGRTLAGMPARPPHGAPARVLSLTQATECGTVYAPGEVAALGALAREHGLRVHVDGARFANAVAALGCHPADLSWRAGVDVLCFGGSKNGALAAEAVVFFDPSLAHDFAHRRKRSGHLWSKQRFLRAQFEALFDDGLWLRLATHANTMARRHRIKGIANMQSGNGTGRSFDQTIPGIGKDNCGSVVAVFDARGENSNHALVPGFVKQTQSPRQCIFIRVQYFLQHRHGFLLHT